MVGIERFHNVAQTARAEAPITLTGDRTGVTVRSGRIARWIGSLSASRNRDVADRFAQSLTNHYGAELSSHALRSAGLDRMLSSGRPLRARHVRQVIDHAERLQADFQQSAERAGRAYSRPVAVGADATLLGTALNDVARKMQPNDPTLAALVDIEALGDRVQEAIVAAGRDGGHFVTTEEAAGILQETVGQALQTARAEAREGALARLSLDHPDSLGRQALERAAAAAGQGETIAVDRLTPDVRELLASRFDWVVSNDLKAAAYGDDAALKAVADRVAADFVAERMAAGRAVDALPLDAAVKATLRECVLNDGIPAELVPVMGKAYGQVGGQVAALADPSLNARDLQGPLSAIRQAMTEAFAEARAEVTPEREDALHHGFWRFLLAPGGDGQASAIAERMQQPASPLRQIGEAANWYRHEFPVTAEADRTFNLPRDPALDGTPVYLPESFGKATEYSVTLNALAAVVLPDARYAEGKPPLPASDNVSDGTIAALRGLGITMPPPNRLGETNRLDHLSDPSMAVVREKLDLHVESVADAPLVEGLVGESVKDFNRADYRIGGQLAARDRDAVVAAMRAFCTDSEGRLDERLLKGISTLAYQASLGCVHSACLNPQRPDLSVFDGHPVMAGDPTYEISRSEEGDVIVDISQSGPLTTFVELDEDGAVVPRMLDADSSHFDLQARLRLAAGDWTPQIESVSMDYALFLDASEQ